MDAERRGFISNPGPAVNPFAHVSQSPRPFPQSPRPFPSSFRPFSSVFSPFCLQFPPHFLSLLALFLSHRRPSPSSFRPFPQSPRPSPSSFRPFPQSHRPFPSRLRPFFSVSSPLSLQAPPFFLSLLAPFLCLFLPIFPIISFSIVLSLLAPISDSLPFCPQSLLAFFPQCPGPFSSVFSSFFLLFFQSPSTFCSQSILLVLFRMTSRPSFLSHHPFSSSPWLISCLFLPQVSLKKHTHTLTHAHAHTHTPTPEQTEEKKEKKKKKEKRKNEKK